MLSFFLFFNKTNKLIACKARCYFNDVRINHVLYASAMQSLLDVCYEYCTDNDIIFNLFQYVQYVRSLNQKLINDLFQQSLLAMMPLNLLRKLNI